jgi:hypothetical protein
MVVIDIHIQQIKLNIKIFLKKSLLKKNHFGHQINNEVQYGLSLNFMLYGQNLYDNICRSCSGHNFYKFRSRRLCLLLSFTFHNFTMMNDNMFYYNVIHWIYNICVGKINKYYV